MPDDLATQVGVPRQQGGQRTSQPGTLIGRAQVHMNPEIANPNLLKRLHHAGLRPTIPRVLVLQVLDEAATEPLGIDEMYRRICLGNLHTSPGTIHRVVQQMEKLGLVQIVRDESRKQLFLLSEEPSRTTEQPLGQPQVQFWAVNRSSGVRIPLRDGEGLEHLLAIVVDAGLPLAGGRVAIEIDCPEGLLPRPLVGG